MKKKVYDIAFNYFEFFNAFFGRASKFSFYSYDSPEFFKFLQNIGFIYHDSKFPEITTFVFGNSKINVENLFNYSHYLKHPDYCINFNEYCELLLPKFLTLYKYLFIKAEPKTKFTFINEVAKNFFYGLTFFKVRSWSSDLENFFANYNDDQINAFFKGADFDTLFFLLNRFLEVSSLKEENFSRQIIAYLTSNSFKHGKLRDILPPDLFIFLEKKIKLVQKPFSKDIDSLILYKYLFFQVHDDFLFF